uniref:Neurotransmitter-gated ion-channel ligand-binding domain-containing protein n=1 Tax=Ditylenchus dipsaci TaxID=166011 RepID=A0A915EER4_9BILA
MSLFCTKLNNRVKLAKSASLLDAHESLVSLYRSLLKNYDKDLRPSLRHDLPVDVSFTFSLTHIIDVDERNQILTTNAWIHQTWRDYNLIWDPRLFDGITTVHIPFELLWRPDVILYNNAASEYTKSVMSTDIIVSYDGNVSWTMAGIFKSSCGLDVRYYPFDFQNCVLKFASWAYDGTKIDIRLSSNIGDQSNYMESTEWHLHFIKAQRDSVIYSCCPEPYPFIDVQITIQRRPMFFVFNLILPCVMISGIALLGFYMPSGVVIQNIEIEEEVLN